MYKTRVLMVLTDMKVHVGGGAVKKTYIRMISSIHGSFHLPLFTFQYVAYIYPLSLLNCK